MGRSSPSLAEHRRLVAFGAVFTLASSFGQTFFVGLFGPELRGSLGLGDAGLGALYSAATLASGLTLVWAGRLVDLVPLRPLASGVVLGLALAAALLASASSVAVAGVALYALRLAGQGLMPHTAITTVAREVRRGRGLALSLVGLGFPLGEALLPRARLAAVDALGWRGTWWAIAAVLLGVVLPLTLLLTRPRTVAPRSPTAAPREPAPEAEAPRGADGRDAPDRTLREVLRDPFFFVTLLGVLAPPFIITGLFFHQARLAEVKGWPPNLLAESFVAYALATAVASLGSGPLADRIGAVRLLPVTLVPLGLGSVAAGSLAGDWVAAVYLALFGLTTGATGTVINAAWPELYGVRHLGSIRAAVTAAMVFSTAASPSLFGALLEGGITMDTTALACAVYAGFGVACLGATAARERRVGLRDRRGSRDGRAPDHQASG